MNNCDWDSYSSSLENRIKNLPKVSHENVQKCYDGLITAMLSAADEFFPIKNTARGKIPSPPWWDKECTEAVKKRNAIEKSCNNNLNMQSYLALKNASAACKRFLRKKKLEGWQRFCSSLSPDSPLSSVWNSIRRFRLSHAKVSQTSHSLDWVSPFLNNLAPDSVPNFDQIPFLYSDFEDYKEPNGMSSPFSISEFKFILNRVLDSTPGVDGIPYSFIVNSKPLTLSYILDIINVIIETGDIPQSWKHHIIIPILKPHKDPLNPASYRPISMSSVLSKLAEHLIKIRIEWFLEHNNILASSQFGFRKGKGVSDNLSIFTTDVLVSFSKNESAVAAFLDVSAAYDNVDLLLLKSKLDLLKIPQKFTNFVFNLFSGRSIFVRVPGVNLSTRLLWKGVPQGSVLSPLLYDIYTNDLEAIVFPCSILQYADDIVIYSCDASIEVATCTLQRSLDNLIIWLNSHYLSLSVNKCVVVPFSRRRKIPPINIKINDSQVSVSFEVTFLGRRLNSKLNGSSHINYTVEKCEKRINVMRALAGTWWGAHPTTMRMVYFALVRSLLDFACFTLALVNKSNYHKYDLIQYKCLRIILGAMKSTPVEALQVECSDPPLHLRRQFLSDNYFYKVWHLLSHPLLSKIELLNNFINESNNFWRNKTVPYLVSSYRNIINLKTENLSIRYLQPPIFACDYEVLIFEPKVVLSIGINKQSPNANEKLDLFIRQNTPDAEIFFTDASKSSISTIPDIDTNIVGAALLQRSTGYFKLFKCSPLISNFTAECLAVLECVKFILSSKINKAIIFTDSLSCLYSLLSNPFKKHIPPVVLEIKNYLKQSYDINLQVSLIWIPGHSGIQGNESVDSLAKMAAFQGRSIDVIYCDDLLQMSRPNLFKCWNNNWLNRHNDKAKFYRSIVPSVPLDPWFSKFSLPKKTTSILCRLRFNHCSSPVHLYKLNIFDSPLCQCGLGIGDVTHVLFHCPRYGSPSFYDFLVKYKAPLPCNLSSILSLSNYIYVKCLNKFIIYHKISL